MTGKSDVNDEVANVPMENKASKENNGLAGHKLM